MQKTDDKFLSYMRDFLMQFSKEEVIDFFALEFLKQRNKLINKIEGES